jgi:hypothetical protein
VMMDTVCSSETLVSTYKSTRRYNPKEQHRHFYRRDDWKSHIFLSFLFHIFIHSSLTFFPSIRPSSF